MSRAVVRADPASWGGHAFATSAAASLRRLAALLEAVLAALEREVGHRLFWTADPWEGAAAGSAERALGDAVRRLRLLVAGAVDLAVAAERAGGLLHDAADAAREARERQWRVAEADPWLASAAAREAERVWDELAAADRRAAALVADAAVTARVHLRRHAPAALAPLVRDGLVLDGAGARWPHPDASPEDVADWWASLGDVAQALLLARHPDRLGNVAGIPPAIRDLANRAVLARFTATAEQRRHLLSGLLLDAQLDGRHDDAAELSSALLLHERRARWFAVVAGQLASYDGRVACGPRGTTAEVPVHLLTLDADAFGGKGRAALSFGDTGTARHVAVVVPGLRQRVDPELWRTVVNAWRLSQHVHAVSDEPTAVVAWLGYDTPSSLDVVTDGDARAGARLLATELRGLAAVRAPAPPHLTVVAHSYGSTTAGAMLATEHGLGVDDFVVVGSPGLTVGSAAELDVPPGRVWVGAADNDLVTKLSWFGRDPAGAGFGAQRFDATAPRPSPLNPLPEHSQYFDVGSASLLAIGAVVLGRRHRVTRTAPRPAQRASGSVGRVPGAAGRAA